MRARRVGGAGALVVAHLAVGCSSMQGHEKFHVVRTNPTGQRVVDEYGRPLGTSPFYVALPRMRTLRLGLGTGNTRWFEVRCSYRWLASGVLNVPGVGQGFDLLTGAAWECPSDLMLRAQQGTTTARGQETSETGAGAGSATDVPMGTTRCGRYLAVTPRHFTVWETERLATAWLRSARPGAKPCDAFASATEGEALLERFGLAKSTSLAQWDDWRLRQIAGTLDLTHVVFFEPGEPAYATRTFDVFRQSAEPVVGSVTVGPELDLPPTKGPSLVSWRTLGRILPNAVATGWGSETAVWEYRATKERYDAKSPTSLYFTVTSFDWRDKYRPWDWSWSWLSTELGVFYARDRVRAEEKYRSNGPRSEAPEKDSNGLRTLVPTTTVRRMALTAHFVGAIVGHAPIASLYLRAGLGPVYSYLSGREGVTMKVIPLSFLARLGLLVNMGPAWLVTVEVTSASVGHDYGPWTFSAVAGARIGLGYVFPNPPFL